MLGGQAADLDAAFEPATVRLHVDEQDGTDVVRQGQGEGHQPSPSSGSWSLTTSSPSTTRAGSTSLRSPAITKPPRPSASPTFSCFTTRPRRPESEERHVGK